MKDTISQALSVLNDGGIVIYPTDTAFGIGCRIDREDAIERLFVLRKRPLVKATPVLVDTAQMAKRYATIKDTVLRDLIEPYWPGALTIILPCKKKAVPKLVRGGGKTVGLRIPNHAIARQLIRGVGVGILGPSANFHGEKTPYSVSDLDPKLISLVDYVVPGECTICQASTVIDCSKIPWSIVRQGSSTILKKKSGERVGISIDTSDNKRIIVSLSKNNKEKRIEQAIGKQKSQVVPQLIERLLSQEKIQLTDVSYIRVHTGPGSFTGLRVGIAIANALSFALSIPVNKKKLGEYEIARYS